MRITRSLVVAGLLMPAAIWAAEPTNAELFEMFKQLERKLDTAIAEGNRAKAEAAQAREEAAAAKAELAELKAEQKTAPAKAAASVSLSTTASATPMHLYVEPLMLRASRNGLDYAILDVNSDGYPEGDVRSVTPDYDEAVRLGMRYETGSGNDVYADVAMLKTRADSYTVVQNSNQLWGLWLHPDSEIDDNDVDEAAAAYDLDYVVADVGVGKSFDLGSGFDARLSGGLRYANIDQSFDVRYKQTVAATADRMDVMHIKNEFKGFGPRIGVDLDWKAGHGINLFGSVAGSLMAGNFSLAMREITGLVYSDGTPDTMHDIVNVAEAHEHRMVPVVEMRVGMGYTYRWSDDLLLGLSAGYEWQNWSNMAGARRFNDDVDAQVSSTETDDLSFEGFFLRGEVSF